MPRKYIYIGVGSLWKRYYAGRMVQPMVDVQVDQFRHHVQPRPAVFIRYHVADILSNVVVYFLAFHLGVDRVAAGTVVAVALSALSAHRGHFARCGVYEIRQLFLVAFGVDSSGHDFT